MPLRTCLYLFGKWVRQMREEKGVCLMEPGQQYSHDMHLCALATWSGEMCNTKQSYIIMGAGYPSTYSYNHCCFERALFSPQTGTSGCVYSTSVGESKLGSPSTLTSGLICGSCTSSFMTASRQVSVAVWRIWVYRSLAESTVVSEGPSLAR